MNLLRDALVGLDRVVLAYFLPLTTLQLLLAIVAARAVMRSWRWTGIDGQEDVFAHPLTPGIVVIVPAHDEERSILACARGVLALRYPELELIIIDDGSTDRTFELLRAAFSLVEVQRVVSKDVALVGAVRSVHAATTGSPVVVVRKDHGGTRADALNAGLNTAHQPLVCFLDADTILDERALLGTVKPFIDDPEDVIAVGGVIRVANGSHVESGQMLRYRMPGSWAERIQVVEYLRSFLLARAAWSTLGGLMIISGAFGVFRLDTVVEAGGLDTNSVAEDFELVTRLHHHRRIHGRRHRILLAPEPAAWTEVPPTMRSLGLQRRRWARGLAETLYRHRRMVGRRRYGVVGIVALPYYLVFELLGAVVEVLGIVAVGTGLALGAVDVRFALLVAAVAFTYALLLSVAAITLEEFSFHRYARFTDFVAILGAALLENLGFRQLHAWWRVLGIYAAITCQSKTWQSPERRGFSTGREARVPS